MGSFLNFLSKKKAQEQQIASQPQQAQPQQQMPEYDPNNPMGSLVQIMGPTPAEREAEERRLAENKAKMNAWIGLFNGLGTLGNLYYATKGASYAPSTYNPHQQIEANYQAERQRLDAIQKNRQAYAQQLYNWKKQSADDARREKLLDLQRQNYESLIKERGEKTKQQEELNHAKNEYWKAMAQKNTEQAEYWRLRAQGVPAESAAKIAKDYAQANKANSSGGGGGRNNGTYGYEKRTWVDDNGVRHEERVPTTGGKPESRTRPARKSGSNNSNKKRQSKTRI